MSNYNSQCSKYGNDSSNDFCLTMTWHKNQSRSLCSPLFEKQMKRLRLTWLVHNAVILGTKTFTYSTWYTKNPLLQSVRLFSTLCFWQFSHFMKGLPIYLSVVSHILRKKKKADFPSRINIDSTLYFQNILASGPTSYYYNSILFKRT